jgi:hypothetical protein
MSSFKKYSPARLLVSAFLVFGSVSPGIGATADSQQMMLQTTGALCAQGLYLTYTSVGTLADGYVKKVYDKDATGQILTVYIQIIDRIKEQLNKLQQSGALEGEDITFMAKTLSTYDLLGEEAIAFQTFMTSGGQADIARYDTKRQAAWGNIQELLHLK